MTVVNSSMNVNWTNTPDFTSFLHNANASAGGWMFAGIDFLVFMVLFISLAGVFGWESAILSSGFVAIILSILFLYMGVMSTTMTGIFVGAVVVMIMYVIWSNRWD